MELKQKGLNISVGVISLPRELICSIVSYTPFLRLSDAISALSSAELDTRYPVIYSTRPVVLKQKLGREILLPRGRLSVSGDIFDC